MKSLTQFINEALGSSNEQVLLKTYKEAEKYFNENNRISKVLVKMNLTLDDIQKLYELLDKYGVKKAPIVGHYGGGVNTIAFRRYVEQYLDEWADVTNNQNITSEWFWTGKINGVYRGPHDTSMKDNGIASYEPSSEDIEYIIAAGFNDMSEYSENFANISTLSDALRYAMGNKNDRKIEKMIEYINSPENNKYIMHIISSCNEALNRGIIKEGFLHPFKKCENTNITKEWLEIGEYTSNKLNIPKTDIITKNGIRISIKKEGGSQLSSGSYNESKALLILCARDKRSNLSEEDINEIESILSEKWVDRTYVPGGIKKNPNNDVTVKGKSISKRLQQVFNKYLNNNDNRYNDFKTQVLWEAITGDKKFGETSDASAHYVLVWPKSTKSEAKLYKISEYINHIKDDARFTFTFKSASDNVYQTFRIITK